MFTQVLTERHILVARGYTTSCCSRVCKPGDSVAWWPKGEERVVLHRECLKHTLASMPPSQSEQQFEDTREKLRQELITNGTIFGFDLRKEANGAS